VACAARGELGSCVVERFVLVVPERFHLRRGQLQETRYWGFTFVRCTGTGMPLSLAFHEDFETRVVVTMQSGYMCSAVACVEQLSALFHPRDNGP
jgi:hypothetical protein